MPKDTGRFDARDYVPPQSPEEDHPLWLGGKIALAMVLTHLLCAWIGLTRPTFGVITAAFTATQPPDSSLSSAGQRLAATAAGVALGVGGAYANQFVPAGPWSAVATFAVIGLVAGLLATRSSTMIFTVVVAVVITLTAQDGNETVLAEAMQAAIMIGVGCIVGPAVVWAVEHGRGRLHIRRRDAAGR